VLAVVRRSTRRVSDSGGRSWSPTCPQVCRAALASGGKNGCDHGVLALRVMRQGRPSEAKPFWSALLKGLVKRGLGGVKQVISDAHEGLVALTPMSSAPPAAGPRCSPHGCGRSILSKLGMLVHTLGRPPEDLAEAALWAYLAYYPGVLVCSRRAHPFSERRTGRPKEYL
jgi:hypothetical protein